MGFLRMFGSKNDEQTDRSTQKKQVKDAILSDQHKMIHDLKTPLNGISGMTQLLKETPLSEDQKEYVAVIEESLDAMLEQINKFSNVQDVSTQYSAVEMRRFLQHILAQIKKQPDVNIGIHYKIDSRFPIQVCIEKMVLEAVILEAFEKLFSKRRKELLIETIYQPDEEYALIVMRDKNLAYEDELTHIGEIPFSKDLMDRVDASAINYNIMRTIDGKIRLELYVSYGELKDTMSKKAVSYQATEHLDREVSSAIVKEIKEESPILNTNNQEFSDQKLILIAEDEVVGRVTLKLMLKERYDIIFAKNGEEAVSQYFKRRPDLVLMDIMMPVMNGFEAFDEIEKKDKDRVPIIACTSKVISTEREYLTSYGFDDHLDKPIESDRLDDILSKYMTI